MTLHRCLCATLVVFVAAAAAKAVDFNVYIVTGQSNSLGTTSLETPFDPPPNPIDNQITFFWSNVNGTNTAYPPTLYGDSGGDVTTLQPQQGDGVSPSFWGPEFGLGRKLVDAGISNVLIVKASRGGGGNAFWDKSAFEANNNAGHMWGHLRDTIDASLAKVVAAGHSFEVKGLAYIQGESNSAAEAAIADARLSDLIANVKSHVNANYPGAADDMHAVIGEIAASGSNANRIQTAQLQMALAEDRADVTFVSTSDLPLKSDGIHFGRDAKLAIGERFADVFISVNEVPEPSTTALLSVAVALALGVLVRRHIVATIRTTRA